MRMRMKYRRITFIAALLLLFGASMGWAQVNTYLSVLSENTWYRLSVTQEGTHQLDYATLQGMGIDMSSLNPSQIRLFGNPSGALPEKNGDSRPDDLTEMAICVTGADDGSFDEGDVVLFYGLHHIGYIDEGDVLTLEAHSEVDVLFDALCHHEVILLTRAIDTCGT